MMIMDTNPQLTGGERQRDMLARAEQQRRAQQCRATSRTADQAEPPEPHLGLAPRMMARLRTVIPHPTRQIAEAKAAEGSQPYASP
jgi:hypothetical protein